METKNVEAKPLIGGCGKRCYNSSRNDKVENAAPMSFLNSERITFSWSGINVSTQTEAKKKRGFLDFVMESSSSRQGKQILKNGMLVRYSCVTALSVLSIDASICMKPLLPETAMASVNGIARPGELLAIMGSSGAGKTTLLNVLTARSAPRLVISGLRCANGVRVTSNMLTSVLAYVQQEDLFIGTLTVKEHLIFQALVRMDKHIPYKRRMERVEEVIVASGLTKCENTKIGIKGMRKGISGGEMKRLSFAAEILTNPSLMLCDEPTSGLDSFMAMNIVQVLKELAEQGKTVVCTIHQPSSELYEMFDKILLMAEGRVAFLGTPREAENFCAALGAPCPVNYNPADYFMQLLAVVPGQEEDCKKVVNTMCDEFAGSGYGVKLAAEAAAVEKEEYKFGDYFNGKHKTTPYKASWLAQFSAVLWRSWLTVIKEPLLIKVRVIHTLLLAIVVAIVYFGQMPTNKGVMNINGVIYLLILNMNFQNAFPVINVFCKELPVFLREHKNGMYRTDVYFLSKTLAELPLFVALPLITTTICYFSIGLNPDVSRFLIATAILVLVANTAVSFGYLVSCLSGTVDVAMSLAGPMLIPIMLFGGFFLNLDSIPKYFRWISYLSWIRYGFEGLMVNQWEGVNYINCTENTACPQNGTMVLDMYSLSESDVTTACLSILGLICLLRLLAFLALLLKTYTLE